MVYPNVGKTFMIFALSVLKVLPLLKGKTLMIHQKFAKTVKLFSRVTFVVSQYLSTNLSLFPFCPLKYYYCIYSQKFTIYVQIFKGCSFRRRLKSRIFVGLFSRIISLIGYPPLSSTCIVIIVLKNFEDLIFVDDKLPVKTAKITSLENFYVYSIHRFSLASCIDNVVLN